MEARTIFRPRLVRHYLMAGGSTLGALGVGGLLGLVTSDLLAGAGDRALAHLTLTGWFVFITLIFAFNLGRYAVVDEEEGRISKPTILPRRRPSMMPVNRLKGYVPVRFVYDPSRLVGVIVRTDGGRVFRFDEGRTPGVVPVLLTLLEKHKVSKGPIWPSVSPRPTIMGKVMVGLTILIAILWTAVFLLATFAYVSPGDSGPLADTMLLGLLSGTVALSLVAGTVWRRSFRPERWFFGESASK